MVERFEDFIVWKKAMRLVIEIYKNLKDCKDFGFNDQIQRAGVSIPSNISEGFERQHNKEKIQFYYIAKGSCGELRTQLYHAKELNYIVDNIAKDLISKSNEISAMLYKLIISTNYINSVLKFQD